jgi:hypothetical protein
MEDVMSRRVNLRRIPLRQTLFIDLLIDKTTRKIFFYIFIMIAVGAVIYHFLEGWDWLVTKLITIFYGLNGVILLLTMFDVVRRVRGLELKVDLDNVDSEQ